MHCYITYFLQMLIGLEALPNYNFPAVQNWSSNIGGVKNVLNLRELYIPINKGQSHWLLLRVQLEDKTIELWDSCGYDETNEVFMHSVCRYLYDVHVLEQQQLQGKLEKWRIAWTCSNQSINSPLQGNINDCGIFIYTTEIF